MSHTSESDVASSTVDTSEKYLTFDLDGTQYGLQITKVREIIGLMEITPLPRTPDYVRGCMNLRGQIVPVLDLRRILRMESTEDGASTCIVVVEMGDTDAGMVVDQVHEVLDLTDEQIEDRPELGTSIDLEFVHGMGKKGEKVIILLDITQVLSEGEALTLRRLAEAA